MKTLETLVIEKRVRKGKSSGTTSEGAYWIGLRVPIYQTGGPEYTMEESLHLELRHFRSGSVGAVFEYIYFNSREVQDIYYICENVEIPNLNNVEDVIVLLKGLPLSTSKKCAGYSISDLSKTLVAFGLCEYLAAPDEQEALVV